MLDEPALISSLKNAESKGFKELMRAYGRMVYNTALSIVQYPPDAEDISQEVFITVFKNISSFKGESKLSTWLYRITTTKSLEHLRKRRRKKRFGFMQSLSELFGGGTSAFEPVEFVHPGLSLENKERAAILFAAINQLPEQQKVAFILFETEQLSYQDIAESMNISVSAVESLMFRARARLRKLLGAYYDSHER
ncbi:MAG: RNA polymerase sigma factor [Bacteroidota bacterium]